VEESAVTRLRNDNRPKLKYDDPGSLKDTRGAKRSKEFDMDNAGIG